MDDKTHYILVRVDFAEEGEREMAGIVEDAVRSHGHDARVVESQVMDYDDAQAAFGPVIYFP